jgi:selenocysteine lyase/cysteine desulfurase
MKIRYAAHSLPFESVGKVLLRELEFFGNLHPWLKQRSKGVEIRWLEGQSNDTSAFEKAVDERTTVVAISHANWVNGFWPNFKEV